MNPFAGESPPKSAWGYGWTPASPPMPGGIHTRSKDPICNSRTQTSVENSSEMNNDQYATMPEALLNTMKRDKKPFTYTPGDVNLSEVLADKLQKRIERKKKHSMERAAQYYERLKENNVCQDNLPVFETPKQLLIMPTYNTPLNMYSVENALEALEVQAEMAVQGKSSPLPKISHSQTLPRNHTFRFNEEEEPRNVAQSKAFRVLQVITDTDEEPPVPKHRHDKHYPEETRFTGLRDTKTIPSKFFHTLQRITGTEDEDEDVQDKQSSVAVSKTMNAHGNLTSKATEVRNKTEPQQIRQDQKLAPRPQANSLSQHHDNKSFASVNQSKIINVQKNGPVLKRPAAFLPANMSATGFVSQQSPALFQRGPINPREGTDL